jgi:F0F1-type ATP synthase assembly protein I
LHIRQTRQARCHIGKKVTNSGLTLPAVVGQYHRCTRKQAPTELAMPEEKPSPRETGLYFALGQAGVEMVAPLCIGAWLDWQFDWRPWATVVGAILGFVGGTVHLILMAQQIEREQSEQKKKK